MIDIDIDQPVRWFAQQQANVLRLAIEVAGEVSFRQPHLRPTGESWIFAAIGNRYHRIAIVGVPDSGFERSYGHAICPSDCESTAMRSTRKPVSPRCLQRSPVKIRTRSLPTGVEASITIRQFASSQLWRASSRAATTPWSASTESSESDSIRVHSS